MKLSPIQLVDTTIRKISIEQHLTNPLDDLESSISDLELEHYTKIKRRGSERGGATEELDAWPRYNLLFGLRTTEESPKQIPYAFEVLVSGEIAVNPQQGWDESEVDDRAAQYGFTMLYGVIREAIANTTSRMKWGSFIIPTVSFLDVKYQSHSEEQQLQSGSASANAGTSLP